MIPVYVPPDVIARIEHLVRLAVAAVLHAPRLARWYARCATELADAHDIGTIKLYFPFSTYFVRSWACGPICALILQSVRNAQAVRCAACQQTTTTVALPPLTVEKKCRSSKHRLWPQWRR